MKTMVGKVFSVLAVLVLSVPAFSQHPSGPISLNVPGGTISLFWTITTTTGTTQVGPSTRTVTYSGVQKQVQDVNATCTEDSSNAGSLHITWQINASFTGPSSPTPYGQVSYQFDEQQQSSAYAYCQIANDGCYTGATQDMTSATAYELGFNYYQGDSDNPAAATANVANNVDFGVPTYLNGVWTTPYIQVRTTSDSVSRIYIGNPSSMLFGGSNTDTIMNFNQSGPNGLGGNSLTIHY